MCYVTVTLMILVERPSNARRIAVNRSCNDRLSCIGLYARCSENHSDGAVNSYTTGTEMKDTFRPDDVDYRGISCCRPESHYHPARLQLCLDCHTVTGRHHPDCPRVLYYPPDKPIVVLPYLGPAPTVKECSAYTVRNTLMLSALCLARFLTS